MSERPASVSKYEGLLYSQEPCRDPQEGLAIRGLRVRGRAGLALVGGSGVLTPEMPDARPTLKLFCAITLRDYAPGVCLEPEDPLRMRQVRRGDRQAQGAGARGWHLRVLAQGPLRALFPCP